MQGADKKVALVADVYTANADNNPEKSILFEAVGDADEIYVVQDGRIVEHGKHEDLVANDGLYSHLCKLQDFS